MRYSNMNYYRTDLPTKARQLRRSMTPQEKHLWYDYLKKYTPHFYRQKPLSHYILDFYCPKAVLAIELDGSQHYEDEHILYDEERTEKLNKLGVHILRFTNRDIDVKFREVCTYIDIIVKERLGTTNPTHR